VLDELLDVFDRGRRDHRGARPGGVRGLLGRLIGDGDDHPDRGYPDRRRAADREPFRDDAWDDDRDDDRFRDDDRGPVPVPAGRRRGRGDGGLWDD